MEPSDPTAPTDPGSAADQNRPGTGSFQSGVSGFGGGAVQQEETEALYSQETVTIASVIPQEKMTVEITVDELDITHISTGQSADVTVDALPGEKFTATVTQIASCGESEGGNSKFSVVLTLEKAGDMLPGMHASVLITLNTVNNVVSVPVAALTEDGTETILYTSYDEETGALGNPVAVTIGVSDEEYAEILSGIDEGAIYYYPYYDTLVIHDTPDRGGSPFGR